MKHFAIALFSEYELGHCDRITGVTAMFYTEEKVEGEIFGETNKKRPKMVVEIFYWVLANGVFSSPINSSTLIIFHPNGSDSNEKKFFFF